MRRKMVKGKGEKGGREKGGEKDLEEPGCLDTDRAL